MHPLPSPNDVKIAYFLPFVMPCVITKIISGPGISASKITVAI